MIYSEETVRVFAERNRILFMSGLTDQERNTLLAMEDCILRSKYRADKVELAADKLKRGVPDWISAIRTSDQHEFVTLLGRTLAAVIGGER